MFTLMNIRSGDRRAIARAEAFLLDNPDPGVRLRPEEQLERAMNIGQGFLLTQDGAVCGVSLIYQFDVPPLGPVYSEIGTMRITANGYGLQAFLAKFHLLQIRLEEYEDEPPGVFAVVSPDTASAHNMCDIVGMSPWAPPRELEAVRGAGGVPFSPDKVVLLASRDNFTAAVRDLRSWHERDNLFRCPKGNDFIRAELGWFRPELLATEF